MACVCSRGDGARTGLRNRTFPRLKQTTAILGGEAAERVVGFTWVKVWAVEDRFPWSRSPDTDTVLWGEEPPTAGPGSPMSVLTGRVRQAYGVKGEELKGGVVNMRRRRSRHMKRQVGGGSQPIINTSASQKEMNP